MILTSKAYLVWTDSSFLFYPLACPSLLFGLKTSLCTCNPNFPVLPVLNAVSLCTLVLLHFVFHFSHVASFEGLYRSKLEQRCVQGRVR